MLYVNNGFAWHFLTGIQAQFNTTAKCRLLLYKNTAPVNTASFSEAAYTSDLIATFNNTFTVQVANDTGFTANYPATRPTLSNVAAFPSVIATGSGTVNWGVLINPITPTIFIISTVTGLGTSSMIIINNQSNTGNVITIGDTINIIGFGLTFSTT